MGNDWKALFYLTCGAVSHCSCIMNNEMRRPNWLQPVWPSGKETCMVKKYHTNASNAIIEQDSIKTSAEVRHED